MSLPDYYSRFNPDLLALIPPDAKVVLEIGCGAGALCEAYRRVNPGVEWIGVESNLEASQVAAQRGLEVVHRDAEDYVWFALPDFSKPPGLDCVVLGDVLEHLNDPWELVREIAKHASPGAQVLASIPNVQHWTVIRDLLAGKWEYQDEGLLDRTHLRFFTLDSIRKMFDGAGLHIHEIRGRDLCNTGWEEWDESIDWLKMSDSVDAGEQRRRARAYQYIVRAVKPVTNREIWASEHQHFESDKFETKVWESPKPIAKLHIHAVTGEECCARPRIHEPFAAMRTVPGVTCEILNPSMFYPNRTGPNILIQQRFRAVDMHHQKLWMIDDWLLIAELDDEPEAIGVDPMALRAVHAVQVSTEPLAEIVRRYNPNVMVFPNQIASLPPLKDKEREDDGSREETWIFYGAQNRESDWVPIMPGLNRVIRETHNLSFTVFHDKAFFDALETTHKTFFPFSEYRLYCLAMSKCDIALLPLEPSRFNECKSDIKFLECAAKGVVVLMSDAAYRYSVLKRGDDPNNMIFLAGKTYEDSHEFESNLRKLIKSPDLRHNTAGIAYKNVRDNRMLGQHFRKRLAWYRDLLSSKEDLTRQLLERVPELRPQHALATTYP